LALTLPRPFPGAIIAPNDPGLTESMGVKFRDISGSMQDTVDWFRETGQV
jgi:hypothetical protein